MDWRELANCRGMDPDLFFPVGNSSSVAALVQIDEAKAVCSSCPVAQQCLDWAMHVDPVEGIWGGTTEAERRAKRRRALAYRNTARTAA
ncbi:WhiB family transcriptional regulator [Streptomyces brasiliensis]|uniref:Transcriptional regulator WhiB n=1 Tax=Streptomyces brasiliensis TaxID=1954 RepID=A0A917UJK9_9ACTN|nr:WhiB family transcriptional regulator [Streptomyces brasiliensis]GGJ61399.1 transcriptional regulator WhiB [Streptomyces brasiliensis]